MSFEGTTKDVPVGQVIFPLEFDWNLILSEFTGCNKHDLEGLGTRTFK